MTSDGLMLLRSLLLSVTLTCSAGLASAEMVDFPEDDFWRTLARNLYDGPPDFEALARKSDTYRKADEFARGEVLIQEVARLESEYEGFGDDLLVRLRAEIRLGDYDAARGGFPISLFTPGTYLDVGPGLIFANAADYAILPMEVDAARELRDREGRAGRTVGVLTLGDIGKAPGGQRRLMANVYSFDYVDRDGNVLASLSKPPAFIDMDETARAVLVAKTQRRILDLAGLPPIGSDWPTVRDALLSGGGYAASYARFSDDAKVAIEPGRVVAEDLSQAKTLRLGFGNDAEFVGRMFALQSPMARARMPEGQIDVGFTGAALDCNTPDVLDACGVLILDRVNGNWILTGAEGVVELDMADYAQAFPTIVGDDLPAFQRTDQHVAFAANWLAGRTDEMAAGGHVMSARYTLGEALDDGPRYVRPTEPWRLQSVNHEITAYAVDGGEDRTPLIFTMAQPPSDPSPPPSTQTQASPASKSPAAPPPFGTMSFGN